MVSFPDDTNSKITLFQDPRFIAFFLAAALVAVAGPIIVALSMLGLVTFESAYGPVSWHGHEMFYGYLSAILGGCFLAVARIPVSRMQWLALLSLWLSGRVGMIASSYLGTGLAALLDMLFPVALVAVTLMAFPQNRRWEYAVACALLFLFGVGNLLWHFPSFAGPLWGVYVSLSTVVLLFVLVGGRIVPIISGISFSEKENDRPALYGLIEKLSGIAVAIGLVAMGMLLSGQGDFLPVAGWGFILAAFLNVFRLIGWRGWRFYRRPQILIYHIAFMWLTIAFLLLGSVYLGVVEIAFSTALHAFVSGAASVLALALMVQAYEDKYDPLSVVMITTLCALVNVGALLRISIEWLPFEYAYTIGLASVVWSSAFLLFLFVYLKQYFKE